MLYLFFYQKFQAHGKHSPPHTTQLITYYDKVRICGIFLQFFSLVEAVSSELNFSAKLYFSKPMFHTWTVMYLPTIKDVRMHLINIMRLTRIILKIVETNEMRVFVISTKRLFYDPVDFNQFLIPQKCAIFYQ